MSFSAIKLSQTLINLKDYPFEQLEKRVQNLRQGGIKVIDFGVGDPVFETPQLIRRGCIEGVERFKGVGYPSYIGLRELLEEASLWMKKKLGVTLSPEEEIIVTNGSKEAIFHFPFAFLDPGDIVLCPSPGYPPYNRGTLFAKGIPYFYPLMEENDFLPPLDFIPESILEKTKILWICYPNAPTGKVATRSELEEIRKVAEKWGFIVASDEAYYDFYYTEKEPCSILEVMEEGAVSFFSLSKRSAMTGYRVGWMAGDKRIVSAFKKLKTNIDSGVANFVQTAAVSALKDETHVEEMRKVYKRIRDKLCNTLKEVGFEVKPPEGSLYLWLKAPRGFTGIELAERLLDPTIAIATLPGEWLSQPLPDGTIPGKQYVRFSFTVEESEVEIACERLKNRFFIPPLSH